MGHYDIMQVCLNGHKISQTARKYPTGKKFCQICGEKTITQCPDCRKDIRGEYHYDPTPGIIDLTGSTELDIPKNCINCGNAYPWTKNELEHKEITNENSSKPDKIILQILSRFHLVVKQIRSRYNQRETLDVEDEYDVQDLLHSLLLIYFDDVRKEEWTPSYAGGSSRMDFLLKDERIVIEVKKTRKSLEAKELGKQLIDDIERYQIHQDCKTLICFVYDPDGRIANPRGLENDLNREIGEFKVIVYIVPKGY